MVKNLFSLLSMRQNTILSGAFILMVAVFLSRFLGLIRYRLLLHNFDSSEAAIFIAAFKLPDLIFQLLIFGTLSVAFIPIFTEQLSKKGEKEAFEFASNILNLSLFVFSIIALLVFIFTPVLNSVILPGFSGSSKLVTDQLTRLILLSEILLVIGSFFIGVSNSFQRYMVPALAPLVYNLGIIFGIIFLTPFFGIAGPAVGVVLGAALHVLVQLPLMKSLGYEYSFSFNFFDSGVKEVFKMMSVRNIGLAVEQLGEVVGVSLATLISYSAVTQLAIAQVLHAVPIGLFGATLAQAALPVLSREQTRKEKESFKFTLLTTMHQILFLTLPAAAILIVLRIPVVRLVYGASKFSWSDTVSTGTTLALFSLGLVAQSVMLLLIRGFYAIKDVRTPVVISVISVLINVILSIFFIHFLNLDVWCLGLSYAVASNVAFALLLYSLDKKVGGFNKKNLLMPGFKMLVAAIIAAIALYLPIKALDQLVFDTTRTVNLVILTGIASLFGLLVYLWLVWMMKVKELTTFIELAKKISRFQSKLRSEEIIKDSTV